MFLVEADGADAARGNRELQLREGSQSTELDAAELARIVPGIETGDIAYALFEEQSGYADPVATTRAYLAAASRNGARTREHAPVDELLVDGSRLRGVRVGDERFEADVVVLAAGAWSPKLAQAIGLEIPMQITREQDVVYETNGQPPPEVSVSSQIDRIYFRPLREHGRNLIVAGRGFPKEYEHVDPDRYDHDVDESFEADVLARLSRRVPGLSEVRLVDSRVGLYSVPPDWHPILGPVPGYEGLFLATGGSGHSFKLGPAIGELVAASVANDTVDFADIERFSISRFERGELFGSAFGGNRA